MRVEFIKSWSWQYLFYFTYEIIIIHKRISALAIICIEIDCLRQILHFVNEHTILLVDLKWTILILLHNIFWSVDVWDNLDSKSLSSDILFHRLPYLRKTLKTVLIKQEMRKKYWKVKTHNNWFPSSSKWFILFLSRLIIFVNPLKLNDSLRKKS